MFRFHGCRALLVDVFWFVLFVCVCRLSVLHVAVVLFVLPISICAGIRPIAIHLWLQIAIAHGICILGVLFVRGGCGT